MAFVFDKVVEQFKDVAGKTRLRILCKDGAVEESFFLKFQAPPSKTEQDTAVDKFLAQLNLDRYPPPVPKPAISLSSSAISELKAAGVTLLAVDETEAGKVPVDEVQAKPEGPKPIVEVKV